MGGDVVGGDHGAFVLWMAHFFKCNTRQWARFLSITKKCTELGFGGTREKEFKKLTQQKVIWL